ncbi:MAG: methylated-DNA--[protein]-cysteine S-methyltransferase [Saprospiraceae bacterium]
MSDVKMIFTKTIHTPIGEMRLCATEKGLSILEFEDRASLPQTMDNVINGRDYTLQDGSNVHIEKAISELKRYFEGSLQEFTVSVDMIGTQFQIGVWESLLSIPYGMTKTYMDQAKLLKNVNGIRAVANANGKNKIAIIVPCHRVIGTNGALTGYGGGLWRKRFLLDLEQNQLGIKPLIFT